MLKLEKGRPADCAGRLEKEVRTYDFLDKLNIEYHCQLFLLIRE